MKVVVPFSNLSPILLQVLDSYKLPIAYRKLEGDDDYRKLMQQLWSEGETVVIVEHDILPWPGAIEELNGCMGLWCSCSYLLGGGYGVYHGFGCTKLSARLMAYLPDLWDEPCHWSLLDQRLWFAARQVGQEPHPHRPPVIHLNPREIGVGSDVPRETIREA